LTLVSIARERPDTPEAMALIDELDAYLDLLYPSGSQHGFSVDQLLAEDVAFFILRYNDALAGCGGVKLFEDDYAEIKRMYMRPLLRKEYCVRSRKDFFWLRYNF
jgi:putative acetyltransferase